MAGRAGWLDGEEFAKVCGLGGLQGVVHVSYEADFDSSFSTLPL